MRPRYLGDSYDIVKQSLLRWLSLLGLWKAHPMFTEPVTAQEAMVFSGLLGVQLLSAEVFQTETNRQAYFGAARACEDHLFLDPDTGLRLKPTTGKGHPSYLFGPEVVSLVLERPMKLTMVFDQSLPRGREREQIVKKMEFLEEHGIFSFAYISHACFILMSSKQEPVEKALEVVQRESGLPPARFARNIRSHNPALQRIAEKAGFR